MALKSGQMAHIETPDDSWYKIGRFLDTAAVAESPFLYRYNPFAPDTATQRHGRLPSQTMTAVGLLMRLYSGSGCSQVNMIRGANYLSKHLPSVQDRDTYYWYYATQVMFHMGDEYWDTWKAQLYPILSESQMTSGPFAGSWDPQRPLPDKWGRHAGRLYVTTMNLLSLGVTYRHLPIYDDVR